MDDLVFKVIPAEGFDPLTAADRASNPTPSRKGAAPVPQQNEAAVPVAESRLSCPTFRQKDGGAAASGMPMTAAEMPVQPVLPQDQSGRASCPTPTRRSAASAQPAPAPAAPAAPAVFQDPNARLSNPTPTRRRGALQPSSAAGTAVYPADPAVPAELQRAEVRASNPTPRRRGSQPAPAPAAPYPDEAGSRLSNPTPSFLK